MSMDNLPPALQPLHSMMDCGVLPHPSTIQNAVYVLQPCQAFHSVLRPEYPYAAMRRDSKPHLLLDETYSQGQAWLHIGVMQGQAYKLSTHQKRKRLDVPGHQHFSGTNVSRAIEQCAVTLCDRGSSF